MHITFNHMNNKKILQVLTLLFVGLASNQILAGERLLATGGVMQIEGSAGGGLTPWALIAGYGTREEIGASAFYTHAKTNDDFDDYNRNRFRRFRADENGERFKN